MINPAGLKIIQTFEGLRTVAYPDQRGRLTIGYGHTAGVQAGDTCTEIDALRWLRDDVLSAETDIHRFVKVPLNDNQCSALICLVYNIGGTQFYISTLLRVLNEMDYEDAADEFLVWVKCRGQVDPGLERRRQAERALFMTPVPS